MESINENKDVGPWHSLLFHESVDLPVRCALGGFLEP